MPLADPLLIESLDMQARGIARRDGKVVFVEGALPGECVQAHAVQSRPSYEVAALDRIVRASAQRVVPPCPHIAACGGCVMQHLEPAAQVAVKQRVLEDALRRIGNLPPTAMLAPLQGQAWGYRQRARLAVQVGEARPAGQAADAGSQGRGRSRQHAAARGRGRNTTMTLAGGGKDVRRQGAPVSSGAVRLGFRQRGGHQVADLDACAVLPARVSAMLPALRRLVAGLSRPSCLREIEVAVGDAVIVLVAVHAAPLSAGDIGLLRAFAQEHGIRWWLRPVGDCQAPQHPLDAADADALYYDLPEFGVRLPYRPGDFTQVNPQSNRLLVSRALRLLDAQPSDRVADFFCGLGNFTLPLATRARSVWGVEGSQTLTQRAQDAAQRNGLQDRLQFATVNLFEVDARWLRRQKRFDRVLMDPPRDGALALSRALAQLQAGERPDRIVYVSCDPATLARDAGVLVHEGGYRLRRAGVMNLFPHTGHVESIALFDAGA